MDEPKLRPDSDDVIAACEFLKAVERLPFDPDMLGEFAGVATRIFNAWVATLDLGEEVTSGG